MATEVCVCKFSCGFTVRFSFYYCDVQCFIDDDEDDVKGAK